jgi:hypothetical protein
MELHILWGQRICDYDGQYAPEALEIADQLTMDDNPEWFSGKMDEYIRSNDFDSVQAMKIKIKDSDIDNCLYPQRDIVDVEVLPKEEP